MRIEDIDAPRVREGSEASILADHEWLGLDWDEGPVRQSARFERYEEILARLKDDGAVFPCTCTRKEWMAASAPHEAAPRYPGTCREGPTHPERPAAWRFRLDEGPGFEDVHLGAQPGDGGDFVVRRSDGLWAYQLAVVVDDHDTHITEVVRGDDLLGSTSLQLALYAALGWTAPAWLHVPLVLGPDGARLSKRHGAVGVGDYRDAGWSRERILGWLGASLGLCDDAPIALAELLRRFDLRRLPEEPTIAPPID